MLKISRSLHHYALDRRSWDGKINGRSYDIAIDYRAKRFPRQRHAWCDDCVCIEQTSRQACSLLKKSKCRRAACSKVRPLLTVETNCLHDPRAFPYNRSLWSGTRTLSFIQYTFTEWWCPRFRCTVGSSSIISKWYAFRCDPERTAQVKITWSAQRQTVLALYDQETVRNNGQTRCLRLKTSVKLHIDQMIVTRTFRVGNEIVERGSVTKSSKGKKACVERKVGECFQWKHMENVPKDTHVVSVMTNLHKVFSCTKLEGQDWRRGGFFFKKKTGHYRQKEWTSVPLQDL